MTFYRKLLPAKKNSGFKMEWSTGLYNIQIIKMYELIYYLYKNRLADNKAMKQLYKYQYYLTENEQNINPEWGMFVISMDKLYDLCFK